ncbi:hypothetical protein LZ32DRAFT_5341 [Colletotrichum eremochloae]|nr:hypothetical protein LZ32DRAFT_5341 [Colletotrichum eremochloae]
MSNCSSAPLFVGTTTRCFGWRWRLSAVIPSPEAPGTSSSVTGALGNLHPNWRWDLSDLNPTSCLGWLPLYAARRRTCISSDAVCCLHAAAVGQRKYHTERYRILPASSLLLGQMLQAQWNDGRHKIRSIPSPRCAAADFALASLARGRELYLSLPVPPSHEPSVEAKGYLYKTEPLTVVASVT